MSTIVSWPGLVTVTREDMMAIARFHAPHRVIATSPVGGGTREDVTAVYNHQSCEPVGHQSAAIQFLVGNADLLHRQRCQKHDLDPATTVSLGTAASMRCLGVSELAHRDLKVLAICTAGVEGNAGRAGDPASTYEAAGEFHPVGDHEFGTIVTMLFLNRELTAGTLAHTLMMATEAKTALLQDLAVSSLYGPGIATGTGTDQFFAACPIGDQHPLQGAGQHTKAGQLIADAVYAAIEQSLVLQGRLERTARRSLFAQLQRFGLTRDGLVSSAKQLLSPQDAALLEANLIGIDIDPHVVAAGAAIAAVADQLRNDVLPKTCFGDYVETYGTVLGVAASGGRASHDDLRQELVRLHHEGHITDVPTLVVHAVCTGFGRKWADLSFD